VIGGVICLLVPGIPFTNPWPMGIIFLAGELTGGTILYLDRRRYASFDKFIETRESMLSHEIE
jgi:hypothetical protein